MDEVVEWQCVVDTLEPHTLFEEDLVFSVIS